MANKKQQVENLSKLIHTCPHSGQGNRLQQDSDISVLQNLPGASFIMSSPSAPPFVKGKCAEILGKCTALISGGLDYRATTGRTGRSAALLQASEYDRLPKGPSGITDLNSHAKHGFNSEP